jgi:hypothetical protein
MKATENVSRLNNQNADRRRLAFLEVAISSILALLLAMSPRYQPISPIAVSIEGLFAATGFAMAVSGFRFGVGPLKIVALFVAMIHTAILTALMYELHSAW